MQNLRNIEAILLLISTTFGLLSYNRIQDKSIRYYVIWLTLASIAEINLQLFYDILPQGKMVRITYAVLAPINLIIFYIIYNLRFPFKEVSEKVFLSISFLFCCYSFYNLFFHIDDHHSFDRTFLILSIIILLITLRYFQKLILQKEVDDLFKEPLFWLSTGILFYFATNIFSTGFFHNLNAQNKAFSLALYNINYLMGILYNIFGVVAILISIKKKAWTK